VILKRFRQSVLAAACSGKLTADWREQNQSIRPKVQTTVGSLLEQNADLPDKWTAASVEAVCEQIVDCSHSTPKWTVAGVICVRTTNFKAGCLDLSDVRFVSESTYRERTSRLAPKGGDILYSREGGILGIACMVPSGARLCLGQRMMLLRTIPSIYDSTFLMYVLNSPPILERVRDMTGGSSSPHLNVADIKAFPVPLPPLKEQQRIVRRVGACFSLADAIERQVSSAGLRADRLTQAILAKAFRGELVPTEAELARRKGREYEPASVLLERIRAERTNQANTPTKQGERLRHAAKSRRSSTVGA
jgi:type I restriction enzyme S subunit